VERDQRGKVTNVNLLALFSGTNLNEADYQIILHATGVRLAAPFAVVPGVPQTDIAGSDRNTTIIATSDQAATALNQKIFYGGMFEAKDNKTGVAVIGKTVAENLFREDAPIGKSFQLRGQKVLVEGVFSNFAASPLTPGIDYNNAIFIPYDYAKQLTAGALQPYEVLIRPTDAQQTHQVAQNLATALQTAHGGQTDFSVLEPEDSLVIASKLLNVLTSLVTAIAAVSLIVGGIGIMNIMLVAVSERTHEIGIRKSVGATNRQILHQFMTEAVVLSSTGGILGVIFALLTNFLIRVFTNLQPVITWPFMLIAVGVSVCVGIIFGITPAMQAARKDPIEALRRI
ncbi:MAG TPA: FtsX-like permease family protein, partial [Patescibacteria group bacterium]|nr:FtsX-like permease family protein [Patescibacteria group bacterium]